MAWHQLSIDKPHLVYIILGGFTSIFMLCSLFIKEKLYIGEATVATICGVIFGPHAANLINPLTWGNTDQITLEFSRIVLVVQCFAIGVELPKAYMERHWKSVVFLLVPVMTFGWLITSLFIWWMIVPLSWLESLVVAACVTATDPVLASSVVGKGKFAKRVPKHLRDVLSAESGCNDGMAFPFIYLSLYLVRYHLRAREVIFHWTCYTILYECIFGAFYGVMVGYMGRHAIKFAERKGLIDRESFLVFYFVLALFCAGSGSMLGMDDLLIGFAAGVGFSNDGWFTEKTEESHVSNVIDLLLNLAYFVYFGTIIPWDQYNAQAHGLTPWRLVVISIMVILFRRIPAMLALKPLIPDVKTWREALFAGHFGPIGVGAIFAAILARAELETDSTTPLATLPEENEEYQLIYLLWPVVTFLVISSILVHGSSIAVFTLGKRINTLTITLSYTQDNEKGPAWMQRLPRITSQSRSMSRRESSELDIDEKLEVPPGELPPIGIPKLHLRRQREDEYEKRPGSRSSSLGRARRRRRRDRDLEERLGGPVSQSAIAPSRLSEPALVQQESGSDTLFDKSGEPSPQSRQERLGAVSPTSSPERRQLEAERETGVERVPVRRARSPPPEGAAADVEAYEEGDNIIVEDVEGNVIDTIDARHMSAEERSEAIEKARNRLAKDESGKFTKHSHEPHARNEGEELEEEIEQAVIPKSMRQRFDQWKGFGRRKEGEAGPSGTKHPERKRGPAHAYQFGNTVIVEDEDGEVIKTYNIPSETGGGDKTREQQVRDGLRRMSTWVGLGRQAGPAGPAGPGTAAPATSEKRDNSPKEEAEKKRDFRRHISDASSDDGLRMTISRADQYGLTGLQKKTRDAPGTIALGSGRRLSTKDFIRQMQQLDSKNKIREVERSDATEDIKREVRRVAKMEREGLDEPTSPDERPVRGRTETSIGGTAALRRPGVSRRTTSEEEAEDYFSPQRRPRPDRLATHGRHRTLSEGSEEEEEEEEGEIPTHNVRSSVVKHGKGQTAADFRRRHLARIRSEGEEEEENEDEGETAAEKRRRLAALGLGGGDEDSSSEGDEDEPRRTEAAVPEPTYEASSSSAQPKARIQWGGERGREKKDPYDIYAGDPIVGAARKLRRMMKKKS
ncbi:CPA1 family monovalent cation:H+ antiporter [Cladophialophora psammophila CBS 110553]|uniref:CPA1 family monovalent cation:H+ antiporter n=1 Tax=Cladophialophora psammophila CBS 110553 TaxID=1182543 RepID=W9X3C5_9EURO|nr:CPA1 family monovalent cation:H+ antiporter [Cladophialophora psammophila CBS 110553]EXJ74708.1 CPA1 family monovalent cation:H+ antiporter [Cladophialophora psammophila CBS 110553]